MYDDTHDHSIGTDAPAAVGGDASSTLILQAMEGLAQATDRLAHQVMKRLAEMREEMQERLDGGLDALGQRVDETALAIQEHASDPADTGLDRHSTDEIRDTLDALQQVQRKLAESARHAENSMREASEQARDSSPSPAPAEFDETLDKIVDRLERHVTAERNSLEDRICSRLDDLAERMQDLSSELKSRMSDVIDTAETTGRAIESSRQALLDGQDQQLQSLAEGMGAARKSFKEDFEQMAKHLDGWRGDADERLRGASDALAKFQKESSSVFKDFERKSGQRVDKFESQVSDWRDKQNERIRALEKNTEELAEMGQRLEKNHDNIVDLFESEKARAADEETKAAREEARRLNNAGVSSYHAGEFETARELFDKAIDLDKSFSQAFNNLGLAFTELERHDEAAAAFESALELDPDLGATYNNLGYALFLQESYQAAIEMYKEAVGRQCDTSAAYTNLGNAYHKMGDSKRAVDSWRKAIEADPSNERAASYLERVTAGVGEPR